LVVGALQPGEKTAAPCKKEIYIAIGVVMCLKRKKKGSRRGGNNGGHLVMNAHLLSFYSMLA
jgi:hypothetical protein